GKPDEVTAAILAGQEMGLSPMAALRSMHVINGVAGLSAISLRASGVIEHTGQYVPSTSPTTHGHPIAVWRLSIKGLLIAHQR
ncbi:hypothetical protein KBZ21_40455, partial [Streptomyces sp. A73]|nr:hypothetical protein [Streptomyces sp. A73]